MNTITLDITNIFSEQIGREGLDGAALAEAFSNLETYNKDLRHSPYPFMKLPETRFQFHEMKSLAEKIKAQGIKNLVLLGIGGSSLGTETIFNALLHPFHNYGREFRGEAPRYFILDNIDPHKINSIIEVIEPEIEKTFLVVISKSGETPETISQFMIFKELLKKGGGNFQKRIILITGKEKGILNKIAEEEGYQTLNLPDGVGERFSVLTPVGMFPTILMGIAVDEIMDGAQAMSSHIQNKAGMENMAFVLSATLYNMDKNGKPIHVIMPYCERLSGFAD